MKAPLISIIVPLYNSCSLIVKTLDAIKQQSYQGWECIIVDDHSTDDSFNVVQEFIKTDNRFKLFRRPAYLAKGGNNCRNYGFEQSQGEYINWFDSDDIMLPDFLEVKLKNIEGFDFNLCGYHVTDEEVNVKETYEVQQVNDVLREHLLWKLKIITNCVFFRRTFLEGKRLFDENIVRGQETELFTRLFSESPYKAGFIQKPLFNYIQHSKSISNGVSKNSRGYITSRLFVYKKAYSLYPGDKDVLRKLYHGIFMQALNSRIYKHPDLYAECHSLLKGIVTELKSWRHSFVISVLDSNVPKNNSIAYRLKGLFKI